MPTTNTQPFEVIAAPFRVYVAPVGTAFPDVGDPEDDASFDPWTLVGSSGDLNYDRGAGVTVEHAQTMTKWRSVGDAGSRKVFRTEEDLTVKVKVVDITLEQYRHALNQNSVDSSATGSRKIGLSRGFSVATFAVLIRSDVSPYGDGLNMQYEIPVAAQAGSPTVALSKPGEPAALDIEFNALVDANATDESERFGRIVAEDGTT